MATELHGSWSKNLIVLLLAATAMSCDQGGELLMRLTAGKRKDIGQIKTLDKLVHEFEVDLSQKPYGWVLWIAGGGQITNSPVALSFTNLGTNNLVVQFTSGTILSSDYKLEAGETREVFKGPFGDLYSFIFTRTTGSMDPRLHYKVSLSFAHPESLSRPIQIYVEQWKPSF